MIRNPIAQGGAFPLADTSYDFLLTQGWSMPEDWGRWAIGQRSTMQVALEQGPDYALTIDAFPFCPPQFAGQAVEIGWNDRSLGKHIFASCKPDQITLILPPDVVTSELNTLWFEFEETISPAAVGLSNDQRPLALGFTSLTFARESR